MSATLLLLRYWLPVIIMMVIVSVASTEAFSAQHTSRFIGPFLEWLFPEASPETHHRLMILIRKAAHVTEYAILALLLGRAIQRSFWGDQPRLLRAPLVSTLLIVGGYALIDEYHQTWVASRTGAVTDVLLDFTGALIGLTLLSGIERLRWQSRPHSDPLSTE